jgi:hypothetical protein
MTVKLLATVFRTADNNLDRAVYRSIYPDASMTDNFNRTSPPRDAVHFTQTAGRKAIKSTDTCVKT